MTSCGAVRACGRPAGHRGHHGGFRPVELPPAGQAPTAQDRLGQAPTPAQLHLLAEYLVHGDTAEAARCAGVSYWTAKGELHGLRIRVDAISSLAAAWRLGWVAIPADLAPAHPPRHPPRLDSRTHHHHGVEPVDNRPAVRTR